MVHIEAAPNLFRLEHTNTNWNLPKVCCMHAGWEMEDYWHTLVRKCYKWQGTEVMCYSSLGLKCYSQMSTTCKILSALQKKPPEKYHLNCEFFHGAFLREVFKTSGQSGQNSKILSKL